MYRQQFTCNSSKKKNHKLKTEVISIGDISELHLFIPLITEVNEDNKLLILKTSALPLLVDHLNYNMQ